MLKFMFLFISEHHQIFGLIIKIKKAVSKSETAPFYYE